jgi:hypothetical protein
VLIFLLYDLIVLPRLDVWGATGRDDDAVTWNKINPRQANVENAILNHNRCATGKDFPLFSAGGARSGRFLQF